MATNTISRLIKLGRVGHVNFKNTVLVSFILLSYREVRVQRQMQRFEAFDETDPW